MIEFIAFTKKEYMESLRTYRLVTLAAVLLVFGILSPLTAALLPEILGAIDLGDGVVLTLPEPSAIDSWTQFFSNIGQMGMLAVIISFSGSMANEFSRGTLVNLLTKGMKRHVVILSKFFSASVLWTIGYALCLAVCYVYTAYYWPSDVITNAPFAFFSLWLFGEFLIAILIFSGTLFGSFYGALLSCFGAIVVMALLNISPAIQKFNPISLSGDTLALLSGHKEIADFFPAVIICVSAIVILIIASILVFNKKKV
ncbi:MAG: ABC transporter permease [Oscillospiraceae bacterium]|nr:ABC transporter permease [Oscillospiraceae bacterium]